MPSNVKEMLSAANAAMPKITASELRDRIRNSDVLLVDVRDSAELKDAGKIRGALHVTRGMLEFRADPESPYYNPQFRKDRPVVLYCASGGRSALAGKTLKDFGYQQVFNAGAFKDLLEAGFDKEPG